MVGWQYTLLNVLLVGLCLVITNITQNFGIILDLTGGVCGSTLYFIMPALISQAHEGSSGTTLYFIMPALISQAHEGSSGSSGGSSGSSGSSGSLALSSQTLIHCIMYCTMYSTDLYSITQCQFTTPCIRCQKIENSTVFFSIQLRHCHFIYSFNLVFFHSIKPLQFYLFVRSFFLAFLSFIQGGVARTHFSYWWVFLCSPHLSILRLHLWMMTGRDSSSSVYWIILARLPIDTEY
jgi:hypothetical protein